MKSRLGALVASLAVILVACSSSAATTAPSVAASVAPAPMPKSGDTAAGK